MYGHMWYNNQKEQHETRQYFEEEEALKILSQEYCGNNNIT